MPLSAFLTLAAVIFCIGLFGVMTRRNTIGILLGDRKSTRLNSSHRT